MRRFCRVAVFAVATSGALITGALIDHSVGSVVGQPDTGGCSSNCSVGGVGTGGTNSDGAAQGGYTNLNIPGLVSTSTAGTGAVQEGPSTGHSVITEPITGSISGNFNTLPGDGHCTGAASSLCGP